MTQQARLPVKITKFGNLMKAVPAAYPRDHGRVGPIWLLRAPSTGYAKGRAEAAGAELSHAAGRTGNAAVTAGEAMIEFDTTVRIGRTPSQVSRCWLSSRPTWTAGRRDR